MRLLKVDTLKQGLDPAVGFECIILELKPYSGNQFFSHVINYIHIHFGKLSKMYFLKCLGPFLQYKHCGKGTNSYGKINFLSCTMGDLV